jgi:hypothetical protein
MKKDKDRQVGIRVGLPVFFALELEDVYRHTEGAHRALAFPDFVGLLVGMGLEQYRKGNTTAPIGKDESPEDDNFPEDYPENGLAYRSEKGSIEEEQQAGAGIIPFPGVSLPEPDGFQTQLEDFLHEMGYIE